MDVFQNVLLFEKKSVRIELVIYKLQNYAFFH